MMRKMINRRVRERKQGLFGSFFVILCCVRLRVLPQCHVQISSPERRSAGIGRTELWRNCRPNIAALALFRSEDSIILDQRIHFNQLARPLPYLQGHQPQNIFPLPCPCRGSYLSSLEHSCSIIIFLCCNIFFTKTFFITGLALVPNQALSRQRARKGRGHAPSRGVDPDLLQGQGSRNQGPGLLRDLLGKKITGFLRVLAV